MVWDILRAMGLVYCIKGFFATMNKQREYRYKSFYTSDQTRKELDFLVKLYEENQSSVIRRLITAAYSVLSHDPSLKDTIK